MTRHARRWVVILLAQLALASVFVALGLQTDPLGESAMVSFAAQVGAWNSDLRIGREERGWPVSWCSYEYRVRPSPWSHERSQVDWNPAVVVAAVLTAVTLPLVVAGWRTRTRLWQWAAVGLLTGGGGMAGAYVGGAVTARSAFERRPDGQALLPGHPTRVVGRMVQRWWADAGFDPSWPTYTGVSAIGLGLGAVAGLLAINPFGRRPPAPPPLQPDPAGEGLFTPSGNAL